jgi:hypothetical protein
VDAALDLNHTQNIGAMIKQHFPQVRALAINSFCSVTGNSGRSTPLRLAFAGVVLTCSASWICEDCLQSQFIVLSLRILTCRPACRLWYVSCPEIPASVPFALRPAASCCCCSLPALLVHCGVTLHTATMSSMQSAAMTIQHLSLIALWPAASCCCACCPQSQFIVVSLKEGMFNNANVIFRTKFVDGVSTVTRTVNDSSTAAGHGGSGAARGAHENAYAGGGGGGKAGQRGAAGRQALRESNRS